MDNAEDTAMENSLELNHTTVHNLYEYPDPDLVPRFSWLGETELQEERATTGISNQYIFFPQGHIQGTEDFTPGTAYEYDDSDPDFDFQGGETFSDEQLSDRDSDGLSEELDTSVQQGDGQRTHGGGRSRGRGLRGAPRGKRGIRKAFEPSFKFKGLLSKATNAFIEHRYDEAERYVQEAILTNPEIFSAHSLLSEIHVASGDKHRAINALFNGAHTRHRDKKVWFAVAERIVETAGDEISQWLRMVAYCYSRVIGLDSTNTEARRQRAALNTELRHYGKAAADYKSLLKQSPHDINFLRSLAEIQMKLGKPDIAIQYYDESIAYYYSLEPDRGTTLAWSDVNVYAELLLSSKQYDQGAIKVKELSRWLLGRSSDTFWNLYCDDDREFDLHDDPRRIEVAEFVPGRWGLSAYGEGLPLELRVNLGLLRLGSERGCYEEALNHFLWLAPEHNESGAKLFAYADLLREVADALRGIGQYEHALRFYEPLKQVLDRNDGAFCGDMALCYRKLGMWSEAEEWYRAILQNDASNVPIRIELSRMFEDVGMPERSLSYLNEISNITSREAQIERMRPSKEDKLVADASLQVPSVLARSTRKIPRKSLSARNSEAVNREETTPMLFSQMQSLKGKSENEENTLRRLEWMTIADTLISRFRKKKAFYPADKHTRFVLPFKEVREIRARLPLSLSHGGKDGDTDGLPVASVYDRDLSTSIPTEYDGISFGDWLDIFLEYALLLSQDGNMSSAYDTLAAAYDANVFYYTPGFNFRIHACWSRCALIANNSGVICDIARYFMKESQFVTDSYRFFMVLNRLCKGTNTHFNAGPLQKYVLRQVKAMDFSLIGEPRISASFQEKASYTSKDEAGNPIKAESMDVGLLMLYGQTLYAGTSYSYALNYFFRAYALDPTNPIVNLFLGLGYLHHSLKRQSENRHHLIVQGLSFLAVYYELRRESEQPSERQEAEFNLGRAYQMLGLAHVAIPYYERCLELSRIASEVGSEGLTEDFAVEAAAALQGIWAGNGEQSVAQKITEEWLVI